MAARLGLKDRKILYELDRDCRQSNSQIARKAGLSKQVVNYRIGRLHEMGVIQEHIALINVLKMGFLPFRVLVQFQNMPPQKEEEIIRRFKKDSNVNWIAACFGRWDMTFVFTAKTILEFNKNLAKLLEPYEGHIREKENLLMTDLYQFTRDYIIDENRIVSEKRKKSLYLGGEPEKTDLDGLDLRILRMLSENARENIVKIAENLDSTADVIRYRIKKLIAKNIIQSFRTVINKETLGYQHWNALFKLNSQKREKEMISFLEHIPSIVYATKYMDGFDFGFEIEVKTIEDLHKILNNFRYEFSDVIKSYEMILLFKEHKINYLPNL